ncbi:MAG: condensation domain-containing protein, partial [Terriglobia bacterium]
MLFHSLYASQHGVDIEQMVCHLEEDLEIESFKRAWQSIVERHAVLRTSFRWQNLGEPLQEVHRSVMVPIEELDWRGMTPAERDKRLQIFLETDRKKGFDFGAAPLIRLALLRLDELSYRCIWTFHHILMDGRSFPTVLREVFALYEAFRSGRHMALDQPRPYRHYVQWLKQQKPSASEAFWRTTLEGFAAPTSLLLSPKNAEDGGGYAEQETQLCKQTTAALQSLAEQEGFTFNTIVQGVWALLLSRYSGESTIVFGNTRACRRSAIEGAETMVGLFINTLPLRLDVPPGAELLPWLREVRARHVLMRDHEHSSLVDIQGWSNVPRGIPLFESILVFENYSLNAA